MHGIATLKKDWDIFKEGDKFAITGYLPEYGASIFTKGIRGCTVMLLAWESLDDFSALFDVHLFEETQ